MPPMSGAPPWPPQPQDSFFSGRSVTMQSVVSRRPAMDAAFWRALRVTFAGSTTPAFRRSQYSPVRTL